MTYTHNNMGDPQKPLLSDRNQTQKAMYCLTAFMWPLEKAKPRGTGTHQWLPRVGGGRKGLTSKVHKELFE